MTEFRKLATTQQETPQNLWEVNIYLSWHVDDSVILFNGISTIEGYVMQKLFFHICDLQANNMYLSIFVF